MKYFFIGINNKTFVKNYNTPPLTECRNSYFGFSLKIRNINHYKKKFITYHLPGVSFNV